MTDSILIDLTAPILKTSIGGEEFFGLLTEVAEKKYPAPTDRPRRQTSTQAQYRHYIRSIDLFNSFLEKRHIATINPDETLIDDFYKHLRKTNSNGKDSYWAGLAGNIRTLINELPDKYRNRLILPPGRIKATRRLNHLTPKSQELIKDFICNGKKVSINRRGKFILKQDNLKESTSNTAVESLLTALKQIGINDITELTAEKAEKYNYNSSTANHQLNDMKSLYKYLRAKNFISCYPFEDIPLKENKARNDFTSVNSIERLLDLSDMFNKWNDFLEVRNRAMSIFLYDFASRIKSSTLLSISDVTFVDGFFEIRFKGKTLKGDKEDMYLYNFYPQTEQVMRMYLRLREKYYNNSDALFVSMTTKRALTVGGARNAIKNYLAQKGLRSNKGKQITPHLMRHAFATINQGDRGLGLPRDEMEDRLGHTRRDVLGRNYTHSSRDLALEAHKKRLRKIKIEQQAIEKEIMTADKFKKDFKSSTSKINSTDLMITEQDALDRLSNFGFTTMGLRTHCTRIGKAFKSGGDYYYSEQWVNDVSRNWITKKKAVDALKITEKQYWHWIKRCNIKTVVMGMVSIIRSSDVLAGLNVLAKKMHHESGSVEPIFRER